VKLAIIGGTLLKGISDLSIVAEERVNTPFGSPSGTFVTGTLDDVEIIYINRHGAEHHIAPHQINYKANMFVLKTLEVTDIIAVTAVGGITDSMSPMKWVVPDQIIDYTHGRAQTYSDVNDTKVNHIDFSYPFDETLRNRLISVLKKQPHQHETKGTYGVMQGPRLETVAEIIRLQQDGCDIVGMTAMPEASLARELEMRYATLSLVVNWAAGKGGGLISMEEIKKLITQGNDACEKIVNEVIND
jgi:5'-methylthioadenosine phosphorylase/5'-methylthioinosine phosphorylase